MQAQPDSQVEDTTMKDDFIKVTIYIPKDLYEEVRRLARQRERSFSAQVRFLLEAWVKEHQQKNTPEP